MIRKKCEFCNKKIDGYSDKQVDYMLLQHMISKHKDKVRIDTSEVIK